MRIICFIFSCFIAGLLTAAFGEVAAQKQLVFLHHGTVIARFSEGSNFKCVLKNRLRKSGFIVELNDFSMITSNDTIRFQSIAKLDSRSQHRTTVNSGLGGLLLLGGLGYLAVDGINKALGYNSGGFDTVDRNALIVAGVGAAILFIKPRYQRLKPGTVIRTVDYKSPYYLLLD